MAIELCQLLANSVFLLEFLYLCNTFFCGWDVTEGAEAVSLWNSLSAGSASAVRARDRMSATVRFFPGACEIEAVSHHPELEMLEPEGELVEAFLWAKQRNQ